MVSSREQHSKLILEVKIAIIRTHLMRLRQRSLVFFPTERIATGFRRLSVVS